MTSAAPTFAEPDVDAWGALAAPPLAPATRRAIFATLVAVSLLAHGVTVLLFLAADSLDGRLTTTVQEIPVELVKEMPPGADAKTADAPGTGDGQKPGDTNGSGRPEGAKAAAKPDQPNPPPTPTPQRPDTQAAATPSAAASMADAAKPEPPKPEPSKPEPPKPQPPPPKAVATGSPQASAGAATAKALPRPQPSPPPPAPAHANPPAVPSAAPLAPAPPTSFGPLPGSFNAVVVPSTAIGGQDVVAYRTLVFSQIAKAKRFPEAARARGASGVAVVSFSVDDAGNPVGVTLARSSGDPDIDAEILAMVGRAAPFPPPPQGAQRSFSAAIEFGRDE